MFPSTYALRLQNKTRGRGETPTHFKCGKITYVSIINTIGILERMYLNSCFPYQQAFYSSFTQYLHLRSLLLRGLIIVAYESLVVWLIVLHLPETVISFNLVSGLVFSLDILLDTKVTSCWILQLIRFTFPVMWFSMRTSFPSSMVSLLLLFLISLFL